MFCYGWRVHTQICLHDIRIPEGWRVNVSEESSGSKLRIGSTLKEHWDIVIATEDSIMIQV